MVYYTVSHVSDLCSSAEVCTLLVSQKLLEVLAASTAWHSVHELGTQWSVFTNKECVLTRSVH